MTFVRQWFQKAGTEKKQGLPDREPLRILWRRRRDSDFFSYANKIKDLASHILVKIAQGHQKGHQKILKELTITNNELVKRVYRKRDESQFCQTSMMPFFTSSPVSLLKNALCELRQSLSRRSSAYVRDQCSSQ